MSDEMVWVVRDKVDDLERKLEKIEESLGRRIDELENQVKRLSGWKQCPNCFYWKEPDRLSWLKCKCGYRFSTGRVE